MKKERLHKFKNETKKAAATEAANAKAAKCQKCYEDLESPEGIGAGYTITAPTTEQQQANKFFDLSLPKFIEDANG